MYDCILSSDIYSRDAQSAVKCGLGRISIWPVSHLSDVMMREVEVLVSGTVIKREREKAIMPWYTFGRLPRHQPATENPKVTPAKCT